jgi:hypothetical protein
VVPSRAVLEFDDVYPEKSLCCWDAALGARVGAEVEERSLAVGADRLELKYGTLGHQCSRDAEAGVAVAGLGGPAQSASGAKRSRLADPGSAAQHTQLAGFRCYGRSVGGCTMITAPEAIL